MNNFSSDKQLVQTSQNIRPSTIKTQSICLVQQNTNEKERDKSNSSTQSQSNQLSLNIPCICQKASENKLQNFFINNVCRLCGKNKFERLTKKDLSNVSNNSGFTSINNISSVTNNTQINNTTIKDNNMTVTFKPNQLYKGNFQDSNNQNPLESMTVKERGENKVQQNSKNPRGNIVISNVNSYLVDSEKLKSAKAENEEKNDLSHKHKSVSPSNTNNIINKSQTKIKIANAVAVAKELKGNIKVTIVNKQNNSNANQGLERNDKKITPTSSTILNTKNEKGGVIHTENSRIADNKIIKKTVSTNKSITKK